MKAMDFSIFLVCLPSSMNATHHLLSLFLFFILTGSTVMDIGSFIYIGVTIFSEKKRIVCCTFYATRIALQKGYPYIYNSNELFSD